MQPRTVPLAQDDPLAFQVYVDLVADEDRVIDLTEAVVRTGAPPSTVLTSLARLQALGAVTATDTGFRLARSIEPEGACAWCHTALTGRQRMYCSHTCANRTLHARAAARVAAEKALQRRR